MKVPKLIKLDINKQMYDNIIAKQGDSARYLLFRLLDNGVPFSLEEKTLKVYGVKPDGKLIFNNITIVDIKRGLVEIQLTTQMLAVSGILKLELTIHENGEIFSTLPFEVEVVKSIRDDKAIESTNEFSALTRGLLKLDEWDKLFEETSGKIEEKYTERLNNVSSQLSDIALHSYDNLANRLRNKTIKKIKLIGDSITAGVGSNGFSVPNDGRIILTMSNGDIKREANFTCNSWANLFRRFIQSYDPSIEFFNAGIGGWSTSEALLYKEQWVENDEDVLFVMLGTNDRSKTLEGYRSRIVEFLNYCEKRCNTLIVMCATPAVTDFTTEGDYQYNFGHREINQILQEVCKANNYTFISNYQDMLDFCFNTNVDIKYLMESNGSHPIDKGYEFVWKNIQKRLNIIDNSLNYYKRDEYRDARVRTEVQLNNVMNLDDMDLYEVGFNLWTVSSSKVDVWGVPKAGILVTYKPNHSPSYYRYCSQTLYVVSSADIYIRGHNGTSFNDTWNKIETLKPNEGKPLVINNRDTVLATQKPSDFIGKNNIIKCCITSAQKKGYPEDKAGIVTVSSVGGDVSPKFIYRTYDVYGETSIYKQFAIDANTWSNWTKIS